jgi:ferric-dicitrate binding protein FerR (iron transport regulator)
MNADDDDLGALLRAAGRRDAPPPDVARLIRDAAHAEWRGVVAARSRVRRQRTAYALAAGVAALAVSVLVFRPATAPVPSGAIVAHVVRGSGDVQVRAPGSAWQPLAAGASVPDGAMLRTAAGAGAVLAWSTGANVRIDARSRASFEPRRVVLDEGAVYVDGDAARAAPDVATPLGFVRHLGTRYEVRYEPAGLRVTVRDGRVALAGGPAPVEAAGGERVSVAPDGLVARERVPTYGPEWSWTDGLAPAFAIEGRNVEEFVAWAAHETGREPAYANAPAREAARGVVLRGSIEGLAPDAALDAVLATTRLRAEVRDGRVVVGFRDDTAGTVR